MPVSEYLGDDCEEFDYYKAYHDLKVENKRLKKALGAFYDFCECEMGWQYFRAEYELTDSPNATLSNAKKLKAFLEEMRATRKDMEGEA
jgi:hypothetical protein